MSKRIENIMAKYSDRDFEALYSIYKYRCLSFEQLYELHYKKSIKSSRDVTPEYLKKKIVQMKKDELIEENIHMDNTVPMLYSLTTDGVTAIKKHFVFPNNVYNSERRMAERGYLTSSEVKVSYRFMPHQYNLNSFAIDAKAILDKYNVPNEYFDEKRVPPSLTIRPDGLTTTDKFDIFYEMDMGTETKHQLTEKWDHYRAYLRSSKNDPTRKKIILFICRDRGRINQRINVIKDSISEYFIDCITPDVEMYVGTPTKLMAIIRTKIIHDYFGLEYSLNNDLRTLLVKNGYKVAEGKQLSNLFDGSNFLYYIQNENGREYMVEEFFGEPISAIHEAMFYNKISSKYNEQYKKDIPLLIVATSEQTILNNCHVFNINTPNVFFTTIKRLETLPFHSAIFKVNQGDMFCFDPSFTNTVSATPLDK